MTDFYSVLRTALDRVGAASNDERDRVYGHVRDVMERKLRNHRPPVGETEIASRIVAFEAAIDRIEGEIAADAEAEMRARQHARRAERPEPAYDSVAERAGDEGIAGASWNDSPRYRDDPPENEHEPEYADFEEDEVDRGRVDFGEDSQGPEPMWGVPAIDMAWDESREQWRDVRRPRDAFANGVADWDDGVDEDQLAKERSGPRSRRQPQAGIEPSFSVDEDEFDSSEDDEIQVERTTASRPDARRKRGRWGKRLIGRGSRKARPSPAQDLSEESYGEERSARAESAEKPRRGRRGKVGKRAQRRSQADVQNSDPIAALASKLEASRNGYERSEPLLLQPPETDDDRLYLPSPDHLGEVDPDNDFDEAPRRSRRDRRQERRKRGGARKARERAPGFDDSDFDGEEQPPARGRAARREKRPSRKELRRARREERRAETSPGRRRIWIAGIFLVSAGLFAWAAFVLLPNMFNSDDGADGALPAAAATPDPIAETPPAPQPVNVGDGIVMFAGTDPSVFEAGTDNPIDFQADGGFVRIGSSINTGGARLIVEPSVAAALAGHQVRVVIEARGSPGQAAGAVRLAYRQDLLILDWRLARLIGEFAVITATWIVPERTTDGTDYMLIEPGVAGDGTAIDIRNVRFEILD